MGGSLNYLYMKPRTLFIYDPERINQNYVPTTNIYENQDTKSTLNTEEKVDENIIEPKINFNTEVKIDENIIEQTITSIIEETVVCDKNISENHTSVEKENESKTKSIIIILTVLGFIIIVGIVFLIYFCKKKISNSVVNNIHNKNFGSTENLKM